VEQREMSTPKVSIIIPTYNGADLLLEAIQSVLDQTYHNFELLVVDDASPDHTLDAVAQIIDPRLKYIRHEENRGVNQSRVTGIVESSGEIIAWLDQDDLFHPKKLEKHVAFLEEHPDVGMSYNSRFDFNHSSTTIRDIWRQPKSLGVSDLVMGFPISPSEMVFTRDWVIRKDLWEGNYGISGGEIPFTCRLKFSGCRFGHVDMALNYRRFHSGRLFTNLSARCESELECQKMVFNDQRCPPEVLALQDIAYSRTYMVFSSIALMQRETDLAQTYLRKAVQLNPVIAKGNPCQLVRRWTEFSVADDSADHESLLRDIFSQLPPELSSLSNQQSWSVAQGYLTKGSRSIIWGRLIDGKYYLEKAKNLGAHVDETYVSSITDKLINYEHEFGTGSTQEIIRMLEPHLEQIGGRRAVKWLKGSYLINSAFCDYHAGKYSSVQKNVLSAITNDPSYLTNRGVISILFRSKFRTKPV
jgi:glycosyltransferase involved in cell wall biosynthesis